MIHDDKVILTDCDGVLLNWQYAFDCWMEEKGYEKTIKHNRHYHVTDQYNLTILESKKLVSKLERYSGGSKTKNL